jgi:hypothetical protein
MVPKPPSDSNSVPTTDDTNRFVQLNNFPTGQYVQEVPQTNADDEVFSSVVSSK